MAKLWVYGMGEEKKIYRDNQKIMRIPQKPGQLARKKINIQLLSQYDLILQVFTQNEQPTLPRKDDLKARMPRLWPPEAFLPSVAGSNPQKPRIFQESQGPRLLSESSSIFSGAQEFQLPVQQMDQG